MTTKNVSLERRVTIGCPQGSFCGPDFQNLLYNSIFKLEITRHTKVIAFSNDLMILTKGESIVEYEKYMNLESRKISDWSQRNKLKFNENKSIVMLMSRRQRKEKRKWKDT